MTPAHVAQLIDALVALFDPVVQAIEDTDSAEALLKEMGYQAPSGFSFLKDFSPLLGALMDVVDKTDDLLHGDTEPDYLALFRSLIAALQDIIKLIRDIGATLQTNFPADFLAATGIVAQFPRQLADYLLVRMIERQYPVLHSSLLVTGIIDQGEVITAATPFDVPYMKRVIRWEKLGDYLNSPLPSMQEAYGWNTDNFDYDGLIGNISRFGQSIRFFSSPASPDPDTLHALNDSTDVVTDDNADKLTILKFPLLPVLNSPIGAEVYPVLNATKDKVAGLGLGLYFDPSGGLNFPITDELNLQVKDAGAVPLDAGILVLPGQPLRLVSNIFGGSGPQADLSRFIPEFTYANANQKTLLFDGSVAKLEFTSWALRAGAFAGVGGLYIETDIKGATLTIGAGQGDGFLQKILPAQPLATDFDLTVGFSSKTGLYFGGSPGLDVKLPLHVTVGPIALEGIAVALKPADGKIPLTLGVDISTSIGPLHVVVQNMGAAVTLSFPAKQDGNLGPMQVNLDVKLPDGAGLAIDAAGVTGGGFLKHDADKHEYSGVLQLQFINLALQAFGLITTQVAGGAGYSLLALVDAEFPPIQLGWGFTLDGVGGLLAVHRTASTDALHAALKAGQLSSILFPKSAISNAPVILGQLDTLFPTAPGRFLFGPMALIGWGSPRMLKASIAVVIELPEPVKVILLSRIELRVPDETTPAVRVNMDALGILDLGKDELSFDAVLFDSKLVDFTMSGAMALRAEWGSADHSEFVLAIGGVHPRFTPPPDFPQLQRVTIDMPSGHISKLRLAAYLAVTSNTIQLGANLDFYLGVSEFNVSGHLGFDALLHRDPFRFTSDISGKVAITAGGDDIASVDLEGTFSGPKPYHLAGQFTVHIVFFDVGVGFDYSWGGDLLAVLAPVVDVADMLRTAVADLQNWNALLPPGMSPLVTARQIDGTSILLAHPLGRPEVRERIVPLGLAITRFGDSVPSGATTLTFKALQVGTGTIAQTIQDDFAPAQFFELTDEEKLERPSFERHDAGMRASAPPVTSGASVPKTAAYETFFVDTPGALPREDSGVPPAPPSLIDLQIVLQFGSAGRAVTRSAGRRYQAPGNPIRVGQPAFVLADKITMAPAGIGPAAGSTFSDMHALLAGNPTLQILATHEMTAN